MILPEIAGINQADGLKRVVGNKRLYRDLLAQFAAKQDDAAVRISAALESGDLKLAERIAHTLKGVAGNMGIGQVFAAAEKLERAIRDAEAVEPALLEEFTLVLSRQVQAIRQAMREITPDQPADEEKVKRFRRARGICSNRAPQGAPGVERWRCRRRVSRRQKYSREHRREVTAGCSQHSH